MNQREIKRPHHLYIFGEDDLDNDDVISMVEDTPTYKRSKEVLASIKSKTAGMDNAADSMAAGTNGEEKVDDSFLVYNKRNKIWHFFEQISKDIVVAMKARIKSRWKRCGTSRSSSWKPKPLRGQTMS